MRATVERRVFRPGRRNVTEKVREPPGHGHAEAGGGRSEPLVEVCEGLLELVLGASQVACCHRSRHELVVERRNDDRDPVVVNDPKIEQVLLRQQVPRSGPPGRSELPGSTSSSTGSPPRPSGGAGQQSPTRDPHAAGVTRLSEPSIFLRSATTGR